MTRPASFDGGRVVALGGNGKLAQMIAVVGAMASIASIASCGRPEAAASDPADAAATAVRVSELVTSPATWQNLWGSWPQARYDEPIVYDKDRKQIVLFSGRASTQGPYYDDTWEWDGARSSWNEKTPTGMKPAERAGHMMVYDTERKKTFLFSGWQPGAGFYIPDQWEWDGPTATWTERVLTTAQPSARYGGTMVWDPDRKRAVLFGGFDEATGRKNDLWEWDGTSWSQRTPVGTPPTPRWNHTAAYDTVRKKLVVYGGNTGTGLASAGSYVDETWEWDGTAATWTKIATPASVVYYYYGNVRMSYDAKYGKMVMYYNYNTIYEYDPAAPSWTLVAPAPTRTDPSSYPGSPPSVVYDPDRGVTVLFGGQSDRTLTEYVGADKVFNNRSSFPPGPIQRQDPCIAFDSKAGKLMLFGGYSSVDGLYKQDTWQWSGTDQNWTPKTNANAKPPARRGGMMVYDSKRDQLILFGGYGAAYFNDVWTWSSSAPNWIQQSISGVQPAATYNNDMFYDVARDKVILFENYYNIWELDPATFKWTQRLNTTTGIPTAFTQRGSYEITFDTDRSKILFVGGYGYQAAVGTNVWDADVWEWDTTTSLYSERQTAAGLPQPPGRVRHGVSYDSARRVVVLFAGYDQITGMTGDVNDSWEWDGISGKWTETSPPGVRPLPRESHHQIFDSVRATTVIFGGSVPADGTYGPQEIWQYIASTAPRPNGSGCSAASAATCSSGNCVDGVCCAQTAAQCNGTCKACNVPGMLGTCSNVPANSADDTCASDQACDATQKCKARIGALCATYTDCATGHCADGVCCDSDCSGTCQVCNLNNNRGTCSKVQVGLEDPGTCASDMSQPRFCDTTGVCTNGAKATGKPCTAGGQCMSTYCIDGFCCGGACNNQCYTCGNPGSEGYCSPIATGLPDHSATTACDGATQYCANGTCAMDKKANGKDCTTANDCGSGFCVDGFCCNSACTGVCQACNVTGNVGKCVNAAAGSQDTNSVPACSGTQYCDAAATCQSGLKANGLTCADKTECGSANCVDGVCCDTGCTDKCYACNLTGTLGTCSGLFAGATDGTDCAAPNYCTAQHACTAGKKANGTTCTMDPECGSNFCVDGVCCETSCQGDCRTCANATGTCQFAADGMDPRMSCKGEGVCKGTCNGQGVCRFGPQGVVCEQPGCSPSTGFITNGGMCDGAGHCSAKPSVDCLGFRCYTDAQGAAKCGIDCSKDPECALDYYCSAGAGDGGASDGGAAASDAGASDGGAGASCPKVFDLGHACDRNAQCGSGTCSDGVCCDNDCNKCGSCNMPGTVGHCVPVAAGTDPNNDCIDSASDPTGKCGGMCDGHARCLFPAAGVTCGTCKACNGGGLCNIKPDDDDLCGTIDCDTLDTSCADYHDLTTKRCGALGTCKEANNAASCTDFTNMCGPDAGAGGAGGGAGGSGTGGGAGGKSGTSGTSGKTDGSTDGKTGGSGGGCGCEVGGTGFGGLPLLGLALGIVLTARRRRR